MTKQKGRSENQLKTKIVTHVINSLLLKVLTQHQRPINRSNPAPERGDDPEHGPVEGAVDLLEGGLSRVVHIHNWHMTQEPVGEGLPAGVSRGVTCTNKLDAFQLHPSLVWGEKNIWMYENIVISHDNNTKLNVLDIILNNWLLVEDLK